MVIGPENGSGDSPSSSRAGSRHAVPILVTIALMVAAVAGFLVLKETVDRQEDRLLDTRAGEIVLVLDSAFDGISANMARLGAIARYGNLKRVATTKEASALAREPDADGRTYALVRKVRDQFRVSAVGGPALSKGERLTGPRAQLAARALQIRGLTSGGVLKNGGESSFDLALGPPATPPDHAVLLVSPIEPSKVERTPRGSPFAEFDIAIYASPTADPAQLVIKTSQLPLEGDVLEKQFTVGDDKWLVAMAAREPLAGSFANAAPWILLGIGLFGALVAGTFLNMLQQRRDYALELVEQRTAELQDSLRQLGEAQKSLVMQQRLAAVGQVAAAVGHELRNPLGVMTNALFLARAQLNGDDHEKVVRHLETTEREIAAATVIVESLLGFTRAKQPDKGQVMFEELFDEALSVTPPPEGVEVVRVGFEALPPLDVDRQQLRQVILNLLTNGYQAMEGKGVITVAGRADAHEVELTFADTGPGLDEETAGQIFEPFFTRKASGIGLGLAVTQQIIEAHGGSIKVKSKAGEGAAFVICLPNTIPIKDGSP